MTQLNVKEGACILNKHYNDEVYVQAILDTQIDPAKSRAENAAKNTQIEEIAAQKLGLKTSTFNKYLNSVRSYIKGKTLGPLGNKYTALTNFLIQVAQKCEELAKQKGIILDGVGRKKDKTVESDDENRFFHQIDRDSAGNHSGPTRPRTEQTRPFTLEQPAIAIYRNGLKNREFDKEALQNFDLEAVDHIVQGQGASEDRNFEGQPTRSKTDSSVFFGISSSHFSPLSDAMDIDDESCPLSLPQSQSHQSSRTIAAQNKRVNPSQEMDQKIDLAFQMYHNQVASLAIIAHQTGVSRGTIERYIPIIKECLETEKNGASLSDPKITTICTMHRVYTDHNRIKRILVEARKYKNIYFPSEKTSRQTSSHASSSNEAAPFILSTLPALTQPEPPFPDPADSNDLPNWDEINLDELFDDSFLVSGDLEVNRAEEEPLNSPICPLMTSPIATSEWSTRLSWPTEGIVLPSSQDWSNTEQGARAQSNSLNDELAEENLLRFSGEVLQSKSDEKEGGALKTKKRKQSEIQSSKQSLSKSKEIPLKIRNLDLAFEEWHKTKNNITDTAQKNRICTKTFLKYIRAIADCLVQENQSNNNPLSEGDIKKICNGYDIKKECAIGLVKKWLPEAREKESKTQYLTLRVLTEKGKKRRDTKSKQSGGALEAALDSAFMPAPMQPWPSFPESATPSLRSSPIHSNDLPKSLSNTECTTSLPPLSVYGAKVVTGPPINTKTSKSPIENATSSTISYNENSSSIDRDQDAREEVVGSKSDEKADTKNKKRKQSEIQSSETSSSNSKKPQKKSKNDRLDAAFEMWHNTIDCSITAIARDNKISEAALFRYIRAIADCLVQETELDRPLSEEGIETVCKSRNFRNAKNIQVIKNWLPKAREKENTIKYLNEWEKELGREKSKDTKYKRSGRVLKTASEIQSSETSSSNSKKPQKNSINDRLDAAFTAWHEGKKLNKAANENGVGAPIFAKYVNAIIECLVQESELDNLLSEEEIETICKEYSIRRVENINIVEKWLPEARKEENQTPYLDELTRKRKKLLRK